MSKLSEVLGQSFDSSTVAPSSPNEPWPNGVHVVEITDATIKELKTGAGTGLNLEFTGIGGEVDNRKCWKLLCIRHQTQKTEQIAQQQLSAIAHAVGLVVLEDTDQLFGRQLRIKTKVRPARDGYDASTDVVGFEAMGNATATPAATPARAIAPATAGPAAAPWARKAA